jgi:subtilisin family serine protease
MALWERPMPVSTRVRLLTAVLAGGALFVMGFAPVSVAIPDAEVDVELLDLGLDADQTAFIVRLDAPPASPAAAAAVRAGEPFDVDAYRAELTATQDALLADLAAAGVALLSLEGAVGEEAVEREARLTYVLNAVGVSAPPGAEEAIRAHPDVRAVDPVTEVSTLMDHSVDYTNAPKAWDLGATGAGQSVAVLDTGIDWTHPMFGGDATPPSELHPKVKYYETWTAGHHDGHGHGTHVAGTAAGSSEAGETPLGPARFDGPAKDADIWAYKVLSDAGTGLNLTVVMGIESAAERGADVLNLSLGSEDGDPDAPASEAVNNAAAAGAVSAVAAGNSGPGYSTIGSPAAAHDAVTVGASTDPGDFAYFARGADDPDLRAMEVIPLAGSPIPDDAQQARYVDCGLALTPADCGADATGRIALIERGGTPFTAKATNAEAAGAIAAVIYNDEPGNFAGTLIAVEPGIPVVAMSQEDGHALLEHVDGQVSTVDLVLDWSDPRSIVDQIAGFSSRGPNDDWVIKPDVVAPGNNITAPVPRVGQLASTDGYADAGGTSMAAPHIAGILAQLRQLHPDWTPQMLKTALMNTAVQLTDPQTGDLYSVHDQGAGLVDAHAAATTPMLFGEAYQGHDVYEDGTLARGSVNFGVVEVGKRTTVATDLTFLDVSGEGDRWRLSFEPAATHDRGGEGRDLPTQGFRVQLDRNVRLAADGQASATLQLILDGTRLQEGDYEGRVVATNGDVTLRAPMYVRVEHSQDPADWSGEVFHLQGNEEDGCTGEGRVDVEACGGPFLRADAELSAADPATWTAVGAGGVIRGANDRNIYDPNWTWFLDAGEQATLEGAMTVRWWASCSACGDLGNANWFVRLFADGEEVLDESVRATPDAAGEVSLLEATVELPGPVTATERVTLHIDPQFIDTQTVAVIYYDSQHGCGSDDGPCDSHVVLPLRD